MKVLEELEARGLVADVSDREALGKQLDEGKVTLYAGYDPTSSSLHVGNLVPVILQARLQQAGHQPIVVVGGATGMIGDPSGKSAERNLLDDDTLARNIAGIRMQLARVMNFGTEPVIVNNADWTRGVDYLTFLRDYGKHLTINYMMAKDSVRARLEGETGISYTEFSYMLLQAYDFVHLSKAHGCTLQVGGSDQWGNITAGCELSRKMGGPHLFGLVAPLLLDSTGQKMGKTSTGERVWLDAELTPPYAFYQYWLNVGDADAIKLLKIFSWRSLAEIDEIARAHAADAAARGAQKALAADMTDWVHGKDATAKALETSRGLFSGDGPVLEEGALAQMFQTVEKKAEVTGAELDGGLSIIELLTRTGLAKSNGEARRKLSEGAIYLNNARVESVDTKVTRANLATPSFLLLRLGKKNYAVIRVAHSAT